VVPVRSATVADSVAAAQAPRDRLGAVIDALEVAPPAPAVPGPLEAADEPAVGTVPSAAVQDHPARLEADRHQATPPPPGVVRDRLAADRPQGTADRSAAIGVASAVGRRLRLLPSAAADGPVAAPLAEGLSVVADGRVAGSDGGAKRRETAQ
jgi:hypothetical protein